jgi:cyclase
MAAVEFEAVTPNVFTATKLRGCNPGFVVTSDGVVVIDTPQLPSHAVAMRTEAERHGRIRYVINTEHHVDHIFGNYFFRDTGAVVVHHQRVADNFMKVQPEIDPFAYAEKALEDDPEGRALFPEREHYYKTLKKADVALTGDATLHVGDHTFRLLHVPGHTAGQMAVHVPEERVVFASDTVFSHVQTWLMVSDVDQWLAALDRLAELDVDKIIPGHGPVVPKSYLNVQRSVLMEWVTAVAAALSKGWTREETVQRVTFKDRYPVDIGQEFMMDYIMTLNAGSLYDKLLYRTHGREKGPGPQ